MDTLKDDWKLFYLGCRPLFTRQTKSTPFERIYKVRAYCTHAYALNKSQISEMKWEGRPIDSYFEEEHYHAHIPSLFYPGDHESDIKVRAMDQLFRKVFGLSN